MNKRYYEHTLPIIRGSLSNTYFKSICKLKTNKLLLKNQTIVSTLHDREWKKE